MMEPCCWGSYTQHRDAHKNLKMFDEMHQSEEEEQREKEMEMDEEELEAYRKKMRDMSCFRRFFLKLRPEVWSILEKPYSSRYAQLNALISLAVIILSIATFCLETMERFKKDRQIFEHLEYFYCVFFTFEFVIRLLCCPSLKDFFKNAMTWIDLISTVQFYVSFIWKLDVLDFLFVSRLIRIFRIFRFFKNLSGMQVIGQTLKASANELFLLLLIVTIPMVIFSTLMFYAEKHSDIQFFHSIPESFWWAIITMTTVGYGDIVPKSGYGKIIGAMCACSGVLIVALPVSVIGSNFTLYYSYAQARMRLPKRRSPALVTADKALVNNQDENNKDSPDKETNENGTVMTGLQGVASYMVDVTVPSRERRHAIQPSTNPITRSFRRKRKGATPSVTSALASIANFPINIQNLSEEEEKPTSEIDETHSDDNINSSTNQLKPLRSNTLNSSCGNLEKTKVKEENICKSRSFTDSYHNDHNGKEDTLMVMHGLSKSDGGYINGVERTLSPVERRVKCVIHGDITQYVPKKMNPREIKKRRKFSQQNNYKTSYSYMNNNNGLDRIKKNSSVETTFERERQRKISFGTQLEVFSDERCKSPLQVIVTDDRDFMQPLL